jgi:hypothetical protein
MALSFIERNKQNRLFTNIYSLLKSDYKIGFLFQIIINGKLRFRAGAGCFYFLYFITRIIFKLLHPY